MSGPAASRLSSLVAAGFAVWLATALGTSAAGSQSPPSSGAATSGPADQAPAGTIQVPQAQPSPEPARPQGVIAGRITDVTTQQPIVRARVILSADCPAAVPGAPPCEDPLPQNRVALTDADGRYRITELPAASTFVIRAGHTGYAPQAYGELPPATSPRYVTLAPDQVLENVDLALAPEVVLAGLVQDEDGTPFAGALVEALRAVYVDGRRELIAAAEALTNDRGEFRLSQMSPGQYYVTAFDPAFADVGDAEGPLFHSPTYYPSATSPEDATRITLDPGVAVEAIIIKLRIIRPSRVAGRLRPRDDVLLTAGAIELGPLRNDQYASLSNYRVDIRPDGSYLFANVPPGRYVIRARGETQTLNQSMFGTYSLEVSGRDKSSVDVEMSPGAIVSGFVQWQGRSPVPANRSTIVVRAPMTDGSLSGDAVTGNLQADDTFRLRGLLQGLHYFRLEGLPEPWSLERVELNGADVTDIPVEFRYGQLEPGLRLILTDTAADIIGLLRLSGRDVLHGYAIVAFSTNPTLWYPRSRHLALVRPLDASGRFLIRGLPQGEYFLLATRDVDEGDVGNVRVLQQLSESPDLQRIRVREGERRRLDVRAVLRRSAPLAPDGDTE